MLGRMLVQGLVAATLIGAAAAVYAQAKGDDGDLSPVSAVPLAPSGSSLNTPVAEAREGYIQPAADGFRQADDCGKEKYRDRQDARKRHRDADDDD